MRTAKEKIEQILNLKNLPPEIVMVTDNISDPGVLADLVASNLRLKIDESQAVLEIFDPIERLKKVNELLTRELELSTMQARIQNQAKEEMSKTQRDYYLREQLKQIQQELGEGDERAEEINEVKKQIDKAKMPTEVKREADKQLRRWNRCTRIFRGFARADLSRLACRPTLEQKNQGQSQHQKSQASARRGSL